MSALSLNDMVTALRLRGRHRAPSPTGELLATGEALDSTIEADEHIMELIASHEAHAKIAEIAAMEDPEELDDLIMVKSLPGSTNDMFLCPEEWVIGARAPEPAPLVGDAVDFNKSAPFAAPPQAAPVEESMLKPRPPYPVDAAPPTALNVMLQSSKAVRAPMSPEEEHLKRWFDEAFMKVDIHMHEGEESEWVQCDMDGHKVVISQQRMVEIGMVMEDGSPPLKQDPAQLYWIQDKPVGYKDKYGVWDPVGAQWRMFPERTLVPIEQRIAPLGKGYGGSECGLNMTVDAATFKLEDYGNEEQYINTALEPGLPHIMDQIEALGAGVELPVADGWAVNTANSVAYYTPQLRHVQTDSSIGEAAGKKYVYGFFSRDPVKPVEGKATWDLTNSVWAYPIDACHKPIPSEECCGACPMCSERARDGAMSGK